MREFVILGVFVSASLSSAVGWAVSPEQVHNPRQAGGWVSDQAAILSSTEVAELNRMISAAEAESGIEIAVVTVNEVSTATPKEFATALFNLWGIGKRSTNNGLLVLMVQSERRLEMETGYGTETVLTDGWLKTMQERDMVPRFKEGAFGEGIIEGVGQSIERMRQYELTGEVVDPGAPAPPWLWGLLGGGGVLGGFGVRRLSWRRDRTCPSCEKMMSMLSEEADDAHLSSGQQTEETIGSINWEYWYCEKCSTNKLIGVGKWFSGFSKCSSCGHKTLSSVTNTLQSPTRTSTGLAETISDCKHCSFHSRSTSFLPMLPEPTESSSSSSSSGGGSFGGGSSGGGGAGSSW